MAIGGTINFPGWQSADFSTPGGIMSAYNQAGQNAASVNQQNYSNILAGYQQMMSSQDSRWNQLRRGTMRILRGANRANIKDIDEKYTALSGQGVQSLINRGLGNTTIQQNYNRAVTNDRAEEVTRSRAEFAKIRAGLFSGIGAQGLAANMQLGLSQLGFMERLDAPYPDAGLFASLMQNYGMAAAGAMGGAGGGVMYPPTSGMYRFASDAIPMSYEAGPSGPDAGYMQSVYNPWGQVGYQPPVSGGGGGFNFAGAGGAIAQGAAGALGDYGGGGGGDF